MSDDVVVEEFPEEWLEGPAIKYEVVSKPIEHLSLDVSRERYLPHNEIDNHKDRHERQPNEARDESQEG